MDESRKKPVMIGVIIACFALAGIIVYSQNFGGAGGPGQFKGQPIWVLCSACSASWEMDKAEYFKYIEDNVAGPEVPPLPCNECGEKDVYRAVKCGKCDKVFRYGTVPYDFADRCPDKACGYSQTEEDRKAAAAARREGG